MVCSDFGFSSPTLLQRQTTDLFTKNRRRDLCIDSTPEDGQVLASLFPLLIADRAKNRECLAKAPEVILLLTAQDLIEVIAFLAGEGAASKSYPRCVVLGRTEEAKDDLRTLNEHAHILISTPERLIDHIRRDNVSLKEVRHLVVVRAPFSEVPEEDDRLDSISSFDNDVLYIAAKLSHRRVIRLFGESGSNPTLIKDLLRLPKVLSRKDWLGALHPIIVARVQRLTPEAIPLYAYAEQVVDPLLILCQSDEDRRTITSQITGGSLTGPFTIVTLQDPLPLLDESHALILYGVHAGMMGPALLDRILQNPMLTTRICLLDAEMPIIIDPSQEMYSMKYDTGNTPESQQIMTGKILTIVERVKAEKNPESLLPYIRLVRKLVPFGLRRYVYGYLIRELLGSLQEPRPSSRKGQVSSSTSGDPAVSRTAKERKPRASKTSSPIQEPSSQDAVISADGGVTLFLSVGKYRSVYAKDLARLFKEQLSASEEDILSIKVLDNYSFVTIPQELASRAIEQLNGSRFKGRPLTVNYARKK